MALCMHERRGAWCIYSLTTLSEYFFYNITSLYPLLKTMLLLFTFSSMSLPSPIVEEPRPPDPSSDCYFLLS